MFQSQNHENAKSVKITQQLVFFLKILIDCQIVENLYKISDFLAILIFSYINAIQNEQNKHLYGFFLNFQL